MRNLTSSEIHTTSGGEIISFALGICIGALVTSSIYDDHLKKCAKALSATLNSLGGQLNECHAKNAALLSASNTTSTNTTL